MKCPIDGTDLSITDRQNVEIDYCSKCRGVWLDRGELDKIIEKSEQQNSYSEDHRRDERRRDDERSDDDNRRKDHYRDDYRGGRKKKREGFLGDLFDF